MIEAVCGPPSIIEHMTPVRTGANGALAWASVAQAAAGCGWVPPSRPGPQVRVQCRGVAPRAAATVMANDDVGSDAPEPGTVA